MVYIQRFGQGQRETVSECDSRKTAKQELTDYRLSDPSAHYYLSSRPCRSWKESS